MQIVVPYLTVSNAAEAVDFYKKAFGAQENGRYAEPDGKKRIMHADLTVYGGSVYLMDEFPEHGAHGGARSPNGNGNNAVSMVINRTKPAEVDDAFRKAVAAGCTGVQEPEDTFWNARFAIVADPYGHLWMLNADLPT
jgi:PhnB protein